MRSVSQPFTLLKMVVVDDDDHDEDEGDNDSGVMLTVMMLATM